MLQAMFRLVPQKKSNTTTNWKRTSFSCIHVNVVSTSLTALRRLRKTLVLQPSKHAGLQTAHKGGKMTGFKMHQVLQM